MGFITSRAETPSYRLLCEHSSELWETWRSLCLNTLEDLGAVEYLPLYYTRDNGEFFITRMKDWLLRTDTTVKGISMPANLTIFKNLKDLRVSFSTVIDIKDLSKLQVLEIGRSPEQITSPPNEILPLNWTATKIYNLVRGRPCGWLWKKNAENSVRASKPR